MVLYLQREKRIVQVQVNLRDFQIIQNIIHISLQTEAPLAAFTHPPKQMLTMRTPEKANTQLSQAIHKNAYWNWQPASTTNYLACFVNTVWPTNYLVCFVNTVWPPIAQTLFFFHHHWQEDATLIFSSSRLWAGGMLCSATAQHWNYHNIAPYTSQSAQNEWYPHVTKKRTIHLHAVCLWNGWRIRERPAEW